MARQWPSSSLCFEFSVERTIRLDLEYDGTCFHGFGLQPGLRTVQGVVETALGEVLGHDVRVTPAGRTDAGVHARGQVLSFRTTARLPARAITPALNSHLPDDVHARSTEDVDLDFDARRSARLRHYRYSIWNHQQPNLWSRKYSLHHPERLDLPVMRDASALLLGRHDFTSFIGHAGQAPDHPSPFRTIQRAEWTREDDFLHFDCSANAFARHMVRNLVGSLLWVGRGKWSAGDFQRTLESRNRRAAGPTAPPHGLTLMQVDYVGAGLAPPENPAAGQQTAFSHPEASR